MKTTEEPVETIEEKEEKTENESEKPEPQYVRRGLKAIWRHLRPFKNRLTIFATLGIVSSIANGFVPYLTVLDPFLQTLILFPQFYAAAV